MNNLTKLNNLDSRFSEIIRHLNHEILEYCKDYFEKNLLHLYENKLEMTVIIDANVILSDAYSYVKNNKSFLLTLTQSPFLKICSPLWLQDELDKKIPEFSKKKKIDENKFRNAVLLFKEKIHFIRLENETAYNHAINKIKQRDEKDKSYVLLYFSIKSHGILTKDKHITEIPEIKTWKRPGIVGKVISVFEKGALSFLIVGEGLPKVFKFLYELSMLILRSIWEVVKTIGTVISILFKEGITAISKFPEWVKVFIGIGTIFLIMWDKSREIIVTALQTFVQEIVNLLEWFYNVLKNILNLIAPLIKSGVTILAFLFIKIEETITTYKQINLNGIKNAKTRS